MPKKSIDRNPLAIVTSQGSSSNTDTSLISGLDRNVTADDVITSNDLGGYLGSSVQVNLDDLTSDAREGQPPKIGFGPISFTNGSITIVHDGRPDWGQAKISDNPPWTKQQKKWATQFEMPHYAYGNLPTVYAPYSRDTKYINEGGAYDTVNLSYRDNDIDSDQGIKVTTADKGDGTAYEFGALISQSVPRSAFQSLNSSEIYPYLYSAPSAIEEEVQDFFNSATGISLGLNAGVGTSSLGIKDGQASLSLGSPFRTTTYSVNLTNQLTDLTNPEPPTQDVGIVVSGILFPADRGVVALVRYPSTDNGVSTSFEGTPASTIAEIESRVIAAINLGRGAGPYDGQAGGDLFNNTSASTFPSRITGQYDLYELHTGQYTTESTRSGAIPGVTKDATLGKVRLLSEADAFDGSSTRVGGIPVLFSPYERRAKRHFQDTISWTDFYSQANPETSLGAYAIDNVGNTLSATINTNGAGSIDIDAPNGNLPYVFYAYVKREERNFLSYRLPVLSDYSPSGIKTPTLERDRFFIKRKPNKDEQNSTYESRFDTAGGYVTFGEQDNYSLQVARYRHVIPFTDEYVFDGTTSNGVAGGLAYDTSEPEYNFGTLILMHFKTERAFEAFIRDGVAPSESDLYSQSLLDYTNINNNVGEYLGMTGGDGLTDNVASFQNSKALSVFRPNVNFLRKLEQPSITIKNQAHAYGLNPTTHGNSLAQSNTYFTWVSGVIYASPSSWLSYNGHTETRNDAPLSVASETHHTKFRVEVEISKRADQGANSLSQWTNVEPTSNVPFVTIRPTLQILTSDLTASNNLLASRLEYLEDNTLDQYNATIKHQQVWFNASDLAGGELDGNLAVTPTGDSVKEVTDLSTYESKEGLCTFTTVGLRPSVFVNDPHKQFENLGVMQVVDDLDHNQTGAKKKLLYHSSRKISLLELYGERLTPTGTALGGGSAISNANIYTMVEKGDGNFDDDYWYQNTFDLVGQDYRNNECFAEVYIQLRWENNDPITSVITPKSCGQAFSIYRYDEEGYKVYVELELLPIGGDEANGYALEMCSGWDWVQNHQDVDAGVDPDFYYKADVPVYRTVENTPTRLSAISHMDAKFIAVKDVQYYVECHPSIPFNHDIANGGGVNWIEVGGNVLPEFQIVPSAWPKATQQQTSIYQLTNTWGFGAATSNADLRMMISNTQVAGVLQSVRLYEKLGDTVTYVVDSKGEPIGTHTIAGLQPINAEIGATVHLCGLYFRTWLPYNVLTSFLTLSSQNIDHPHPATSLSLGALRGFGESIIEVQPTGKRELPEYGNYTMDIKGFITVTGMGNRPSEWRYDLHAKDTNTRFPLISLFTPRKDTQERFLDESYRIEHSLKYLFEDKLSDPDTNYQFGNHADVSGATPANGNTELLENLMGPGIPNFGAGVNGGYISFPVRDEFNYTHKQYKIDEIDFGIDPIANPLPNLMKYSTHGYAGYLRNNFHLRRIQMLDQPTDWLEAQVSGFPNMTRNHLSGSKYGTPPRGVLIYPYQDFYGATTQEFGYDLDWNTNVAANRNPLISSHVGYYLPNSNNAIPDSVDTINKDASSWKDIGGTQEPYIRHAQPDYTFNGTYDVGYLRAFDLNFGKSNERSPHLPYWNKDWTETANGQTTDRLAEDADPQGLLESGAWDRNRDKTIKLRLVGVDWDMISYVDPQFPNAHRDGMVYTIDNKHYLMRKRVMRVFVKVPGLTTWLDVGVMNGEVGESYLQYDGDHLARPYAVMNPEGATSDKTHPSIDGAGCCVSYKETYLVEEGLVALDLELDVGFVPAFNVLGTDSFEGSVNEYEWLGSHDEYLGEESKTIWAGNSTRHYGEITYRKWGGGSKEAPILVKVILSNPDAPSYELHPDDANALVNRNDVTDLTLLAANVYGQGGTDAIYDIWPSPNKSYRGHSFPPDDRAPTWARRGLMGIEVLRQDGSNYDYDEVIDRPAFTATNLFGSMDTTTSSGADDRSHYMLHIDQAQQAGLSNSGYLRGAKALRHDGTEIIKTNRQTYTFEGDTLSTIGFGDLTTLSNKGKG